MLPEPISKHHRFKDITGERFGRLTVIGYGGRRLSDGRIVWLCRCDCGAERVLPTVNLRTGNTRSCGCLHSEQLAERSRQRARHGEFSGGLSPSSSKEYNIWRGIKTRCHDTKSKYWRWYGARGITVSDEWLASFEAFLADVGRCPGPEYSLDRINNDGHYEPGNVRWVTHVEQSRNRRGNRFVTYRGERMTVAEASERSGIKHSTASKRLKSGWSEEDAFEQPARYWRRRAARRPDWSHHGSSD